MFGEKLNLKYKQFTMLHTEFKQIVCVSMIDLNYKIKGAYKGLPVLFWN